MSAAAQHLTPAEITRIDGWITKGIHKGLRLNGKAELTAYEHVGTDATGHEKFRESPVVTDLRGQVFERLYTSTRLNSKAAYSFALSAGRDYVRGSRKTLVVSQMDLKSVGDDCNAGESERNDGENPNAELLMPWDRVYLTHYEDPQEESIVKIIDDEQESDRKDVLALLKEERPKDYAFLVRVAPRTNARLGTTVAERMRLRDIRLWMEKRSPDSTFGRLKGAPRHKVARTAKNGG